MSDRAAGGRGTGHEDDFDRLRPRSTDPWAPDAVADLTRDVEGKQLLFSASDAPPARGHAAVSCSACGQRSIVTLVALARLALPSLYLPKVRGEHPVWLRCPACRRRTWVRVQVEI